MRRVLDAASRNQESRQELIRASNWRAPIIVDIVLGSIVFIAGLALSIAWSPVPGGAIGAAGAVYVLLAVRRWRTWTELRGEPVEPD